MSVPRSLTTALAVLMLAAPLAAQGVAPAPVPAEPTVALAAAPVVASVEVTAVTSQSPTMANASVGIRATATASAATPAAAPPQDRVGRNPAMMIVGGVALIAGSFIDGDAGTIIMISGAAIGLYGLWQYLK